MRELTGKVAVITGGASGIGRGLAEAFAAAGMRIVLGDLDERRLREVEVALGEAGTEVLPVRCDVASEASVQALAESAMDHFGAAHVVCNNAGVVGRGDPWTGPTSAWEWIVGINLMGVVHGIRAFLPIMRDQGEGHIVNTASMAGLLAMPGYAPYTATKHAVVGLSEALRGDLQALNEPIGVSVVCPGFIRTNLMEDRWDQSLGAPPPDSTNPVTAGMTAALRDGIVVGMLPSEVAGLVVRAVREDRFWVMTHPDYESLAVDRIRGAFAEPGADAR